MRDATQSQSSSGSPGITGWAVGLFWFGTMTAGPIAYWGLEPLLMQPPAFLAMLTAIAAFPALGWTMCAGAWRSAWTAQRQIESFQARFDRLQSTIEALSVKLDAADDARSAFEARVGDPAKSSDQVPAPQPSAPTESAFPARRSGPMRQAAIRGFDVDATLGATDAPTESEALKQSPFAFPTPRTARQTSPIATPSFTETPERPSVRGVESDQLSRSAKRRSRRNRAKQAPSAPHSTAPSRTLRPFDDATAAHPPVVAEGVAAPPPPRALPALARPSPAWMFWPTPSPHEEDRQVERSFNDDPMINIKSVWMPDPAPALQPRSVTEFEAGEPVAPPIAWAPGVRRPLTVRQLREAQQRAFAR